MTRQHWWVVAILAVLAVGGTFLASVLTYVPDEPAASSPPTAAPTARPTDLPPSEEPAMNGRVTVSGQITDISEPSADGSVLLRHVGIGYLPIIFADGVSNPGFGATLVLAVPEEFEAVSDEAELFAQLIDFTMTDGAPLLVVEVVNR